MATRVLERSELDLASSRRTLVVTWQNPDGKFVKVGQVDSLTDGSVAFHYLPSARRSAGFFPLAECPDLGAAYVSNELPAFLANRVLSTSRPGYAKYLHSLCAGLALR